MILPGCGFCRAAASIVIDRMVAGHEVHVGDFEPEAGDPLNEPGEGRLIRQVSAEGCHSPAYGYVAVVELRTQGSARLARESDLICLCSHWAAPRHLWVSSRKPARWPGLSHRPVQADLIPAEPVIYRIYHDYADDIRRLPAEDRLPRPSIRAGNERAMP